MGGGIILPTVTDYKKSFPDLYLPKAQPALIDVPPMRFFTVEGLGDPNEESGEYAKALEALYGLSYVIKMSKMGGNAPEGYFEYVVPPLEGLWWLEGDVFDVVKLMDKSRYRFLSMIRQPEFVNDSLFDWAKRELQRKKPGIDLHKVRFTTWTEGLCVQCMHIGPYSTESETLDRMRAFVADHGYREDIGAVLPDGTIRRHHEIYIGDPRKTAPDKLKTVLRHPVRKRG
jgi:hypothetical protein